MGVDSDTQIDIENDIEGESVSRTQKDPSDSVKKQIFRSLIVASIIAFFIFQAGLPFLFILLAFAVSILIHEAGHFFVAKKGGMKATEFFVGFGPKIFSFTKGETTYGLKAIPLGAYVKIIGMSTAEQDVAPEDESRAYRSRPFRWRFATVVAGPAANIILAFFILLFVSIFIGKSDPAAWSIQSVVPGAPAATAGISVGEKVTAVNGETVTDYDDFVAKIIDKNGETIDVTVANQNGELRDVSLSLAWRFSDNLVQHYPAFQTGDTPVELNGKPISTFNDFSETIANLPKEKTANVVFYRGGSVYSVDIPQTEAPSSDVVPSGFLGISPVFEVVPTQPAEGISESFLITKEIVFQSVGAFKDVFRPESISAYGDSISTALNGESSSVNEELKENPYNLTLLSAPANPAPQTPEEGRIVSIIGIFRLGAQAAEEGAAIFLMMWALINVFLAVVNLIPLLPFDGGHATIAVWEKVKGMVTRNPGYRVDIRKLMPLSYAVIAFFLILSLSAMWLDIVAPINNPF